MAAIDRAIDACYRFDKQDEGMDTMPYAQRRREELLSELQKNRNQMELNLLDSRLGLPKDISPQKQFTVLLAGAERQSSQLLRVGHYFDVLLFAALRALLASEIRFRASGMWVLALAGAVFHCGRFIRSNVGLSETIG